MAGPRPLGIPMLNGPVTAFGPDGAARIHFKVAAGLHRVPDGVATAALEHQLLVHIGTQWIACVILASGHGVIRPSGPAVGTPDKEVQALLTGIAIALNSREARDGHWIVVLNLDEHEIAGLWRDGDGDAHVVIEFGEPAKVLGWSEIDFAAQAATALDTMAERHRQVDVLARQKVRAALGEKPVRH